MQRGRLKPLPNKGRTRALDAAHVALERGLVSPDASLQKRGVPLHLPLHGEDTKGSRVFLRQDSREQFAGAHKPSQTATPSEQGEGGDIRLLFSRPGAVEHRTPSGRPPLKETGIVRKQSSMCHHISDFLPDETGKIPQLPEDKVEQFLKDTAATRHYQDTHKQEHQQSSKHNSSFTIKNVLSSLGGGKVAPASGEEGKKEVEYVVGLGEKDYKPPLCGEIPFSTQVDSTSVAQFATVHNVKYNEHLMRFFVDKVWALPRPDVIISVAGGAKYFKLSAGHKDRIMKGMMEGTRNLKPWFITGGTDAGVMKYVGEARAKYNPHAPLIGIAPLGALKGFSKLRRICQEESKFVRQTDRFGKETDRWRWTSKEDGDAQSSAENSDCMSRCFAGHEKQLSRASHSAPDDWEWDSKLGSWIRPNDDATCPISSNNLVLSHDKLVEMDELDHRKQDELDRSQSKQQKTGLKKPAPSTTVEPNHSHFIFVDHDGVESAFGKELSFRAAFESCIARNKKHDEGKIQKAITKYMKDKNYRWPNYHPAEGDEEEEEDDDVPLVSVCVEGGLGAITTVCEAVKRGTASLIVRGSGRASDLIGDTVLLMYTEDHDKFVPEYSRTKKQKILFDLLTEQGWVKDHEDIGKCIGEDLLPEIKKLFLQYGFTEKELATTTTEEEKKILDAMFEVLEVAYTNKCYVYDLMSNEPDKEDFNGALLQCILNGIGQNKEKADAQVMWKKLKYAMLWNREDVMNKVLEQADDKGFNYDTRLDDGLKVLEKAVVFALQRNNVNALQKLIDHNAEVEILDVGNKFCFVQWALDLKKSPQNSTGDDNAKEQLKYMEAAKHWQKLITYATKNCTHFRVIAKEISQQYKVLSDHKRALSESDKISQREKQEKRLEHKLQEYIPRPSGQGNLARRPIHAQLRVAIFRYAHNKKKLEKQPDSGKKLDKQADSGSFPGAQTTCGDKKDALLEKLGRVKQMALLESIYIELLGSAFRYRIGIHGPYKDLFFWNVLNNRFEMAMVMWKQVDRPVEAALAAAFLLRQLGKKFEKKDRAASNRMVSHADEFENLGVRIFQAAEEEKSELALQALDSNLELWNGLTLLDLAVQGGSHKFVEECCSDAIDNRLFGDLSRSDSDTKWGMLKLITGILSLGLLPAFFPRFLIWDPPPACESVRRRTQRRKRPQGYPFKPSLNPDIPFKPSPSLNPDIENIPQSRHSGHFTDSKGRVVANKMAEDYSPQELEELWSKTFGVKERFKLFWSAPIVIFLSNALCTIAATLVFYIWFYHERIGPSRFVAEIDADGATTGLTGLFPNISDTWKSETWNVGVETTMACYFYLNIFREALQCTGEVFDAKSWRVGLWIYFFDFWNMFDILSIVAFAVGHGLREADKGRDARLIEIATEEVVFPPHSLFVSGTETPYEAWALFYSLSIFCLCFRVLRVLYISSMGLIVSIFKAMMSDVLQFMAIYIIVVFGFSVIFLGISDPKSLLNDCSQDPAPDDVLTVGTREQQLYMKCIPVNFFMRTFFQSFGEFFLDDMGNLTSLIFFILLFIITNVLLMNLLVALMTSTYEEVSARASRQRLIDRYDLIEENLRRSYTYPVPINLIMVMVKLINFWCVGRKRVQQVHPDCGVWKQWDIFISSWLFVPGSHILSSTDFRLVRDIGLLMRQAQETVEDQDEQKAVFETPPTKMQEGILHLLQMQRQQARKAPATAIQKVSAREREKEREGGGEAGRQAGGWRRGGGGEGASPSAVTAIRDYFAAPPSALAIIGNHW